MTILFLSLNVYILGFILVVSFKKDTLSSQMGRECHTFTTSSRRFRFVPGRHPFHFSSSSARKPPHSPLSPFSHLGLGTTLNDANNFTFEGRRLKLCVVRPLVIPCSGAAGHHRRFHTAAATSKKFPFSTFYVLIHHYCYSP